jgi:hypothetical protein
MPGLYAALKGTCAPIRGLNAVASLDPAVPARLLQRGIGARVEEYGRDFGRFESDLARRNPQSPERFPLVSVPSSAAIDWRTGTLRIHARTFIVAYEKDEPVFISREPQTRAPVKITLTQMRLLHRTWRRWPIVLPSMCLTVLWHWPLSD